MQVLPKLDSGGGGVERGTIEVAQALKAAGWGAVVVSNGGALVHELTRLGVTHYQLPVDSKSYGVIQSNKKKLEEIIRAEKVDIVHARSRAPAWSAHTAAQNAGVHFITTFHGTYGLGWLNAKKAYNKVMTFGERVIAISNFIADHIREHYDVPEEKLRVVHRGVDLRRFDPDLVTAQRMVMLSEKWRLPDGAPVIMLPGRLTRWKGQTVLIEALAKLGRKDVRCLLVGGDQGRDGYREELVRLIEKRGLTEVVHLVGGFEEMPVAYMLTDVVVSASTDPEAFGRVAVEAQAMGRPIIATDHGGSRETVRPGGETGWLVPPNDPEALAAALKDVLALDAAARDDLARRGIAFVRENFSTQAMCEEELKVYEEVLRLPVGGA